MAGHIPAWNVNSTNSSLSWVHYCWENSMKVVLCNTKEELLQKGLLELMLDCLTCLPGKTFAPTHPRTISRINPARVAEHAVPGPVRRGLAGELPAAAAGDPLPKPSRCPPRLPSRPLLFRRAAAARRAPSGRGTPRNLFLRAEKHLLVGLGRCQQRVRQHRRSTALG